MKLSLTKSKYRVRSYALCIALMATSFGGMSASAENRSDDDHDENGHLNKRVTQLEAQVAALQSNELPIEVTVDCGAGQKIADALADHADGHGTLFIHVSGTCDESLVINRSDVTIEGQGAATIIRSAATSAPSTILVTEGAKKIRINNVSLAGSTTATLTANKGAHVVARNIIAQNGGSGVMALDNAVIDVTASIIRNNVQGVYTARGGVISVSGSTVESNTTGALAFKAGIVIFTSSSPNINELTSGPIVRGNVNGAVARSGGYLEFSDTLIEQNTANGVVIDSGSAAHFFVSFTGEGNRIRNNQTNGVFVNKTGSVVFQNLTNVITANTRGILCQPDTGYIVPVGFTVTGNLQGDILGCTP